MQSYDNAILFARKTPKNILKTCIY
jgi:hypothetical protein